MLREGIWLPYSWSPWLRSSSWTLCIRDPQTVRGKTFILHGEPVLYMQHIALIGLIKRTSIFLKKQKELVMNLKWEKNPHLSNMFFPTIPTQAFRKVQKHALLKRFLSKQLLNSLRWTDRRARTSLTSNPGAWVPASHQGWEVLWFVGGRGRNEEEGLGDMLRGHYR